MRWSRQAENLLADFRQLPRTSNRDPDSHTYSIHGVVDVLAEQYKIGDARPERAIMRHWKEVVGESNAARCRPMRIDRQKRLLVQVLNPILRQELQFHHRLILERVRRLPGCRDLCAVLFRAG